MNLRILLFLIILCITLVRATDVTKIETFGRVLQGTSCPTGKYPSGSSCYSCRTGCASCSSYSNCFGCKTGYYSSGSNCYRCLSQCLGCTISYSRCTSCASGYYQSNSYSSFGGYVTCSSCASGCASCTSYSSSSCTSCKSGYSKQSNGSCRYVGSSYNTTRTTSTVSSGGAAGIGVGAGIVCIFLVVVLVIMIRKKNLRKNQQTAADKNKSRGGEMTMGDAQPITPAPGYTTKPVTQSVVMPTPGVTPYNPSPSTNGGYTPHQPAPYMPPQPHPQYSLHHQHSYGPHPTQPQANQLPPGFAHPSNQLPPGFAATQPGSYGNH